MSTIINTPYTLPSGEILNNRIAKAALTERLAGKNRLPNNQHFQLYDTWAKGGAGLLISGNIMIDERFVESSGNVCMHHLSPESLFKKWTQTVVAHGNAFWAQLNHPGRQANLFSTTKPLSASNVQLKKMGFFAKPRPMTEEEIEDVIHRFVKTANLCRRVGFTGVQLHAAHGYLLSQFLSPRTNKRTDQWGGSIENRARILTETIQRMRKLVGGEFSISVKLNSADFQRGGFEEADALYVIKALEALGVDLLEISGGTYEDFVAFTRTNVKESTLQREAYFLEFAKTVRQQCSIPIMVTGGIRSLAFCNETLAKEEMDIVGFGRPFLLDERFPAGFLDGTLDRIEEPTIAVRDPKMLDMAIGGFYDYQIERLANNKPLDLKYAGWKGALRLSKNEMWKGIRNKF